MKLALFADIHSNLEALTACLTHARALGAERYAFLGDLVGYGADPIAVLELIERYADDGAVVVLGNHDAAVTGRYADPMNASAQAAILWTQGQLDGSHRAFLDALPLTVIILVIMVLYVTMVYGPIAAFLVELFPTNIRYTSMSLPYHIGNGWFGGMLPLTATAMVAATGDIYYGLWYPIVVAIMTLIIGSIFLRETKHRDIRTYEHSKAET